MNRHVIELLGSSIQYNYNCIDIPVPYITVNRKVNRPIDNNNPIVK